MQLESDKNVIVFSPHIDDAEIGCGGTISKLVQKGIPLYLVVFGTSDKDVPDGWPKDTLEKEIKVAAKYLGISTSRLILFKYATNQFSKKSREIHDKMVALNVKLKPQLILLPSCRNIDPDHCVVSEEGLRAFYKTSVLTYETPSNDIIFNADTCVDLSKDDLKSKIQALDAYESQKGNPQFSSAFIKSLAITRGTQFRTDFAEAFEVKRLFI